MSHKLWPSSVTLSTKIDHHIFISSLKLKLHKILSKFLMKRDSRLMEANWKATPARILRFQIAAKTHYLPNFVRIKLLNSNSTEFQFDNNVWTL